MTLMPHWPIYTGEVKSINNLNVVRVLHFLGNPQSKMKNVIHITGTNGKGSTASFLHQIIMEHGYSATKYTSPHLLNCNERIIFNKNQITDEELYYYIEKTRYTCEQNNIDITIFEATTIAAFLFFADKNADYNIIEVGMGGLNDATNVFEDEQIACCIITPISLDHVKFLGPTKLDIAKNKIAICKYKRPLICAPQDYDVANFIYSYCSGGGIPLTIYAKDFEVIKIQNDDDTEDDEFFCITYKDSHNNEQEVILPIPNLRGEHQLINLATAFMALLSIEDFEIDQEMLFKGIKNTKWAGRLENINEKHLLKYLPFGSQIYFDGAHNEGGAKVIANFIKSLSKDCNNYLIIARSKDTDSGAFVKPFNNSFIKAIYTTKCHGEVKPEHQEKIYQQIIKQVNLDGNFDKNLVHHSKNLVEALKAIGDCEAADIQDKNTQAKIVDDGYLKPTRVFICGSLYMARDIFVLSKNIN